MSTPTRFATDQPPEILAPAGNKASFLAAIAAGADAVYCGLKHFSARMAADNFSTAELSSLTELAHSKGMKVYVPFNTLIKPDETEKAARQIVRLKKWVNPDAIIIQDPGIIPIARGEGYKGEIHLSTLANLSSPSGLSQAEKLGISRVVTPRELTIDEIRQMAEACPDRLSLEVFIHGALCYAVSGRCYWSSFLGGKSGLRGRCVQPCRRVYNQKGQKNAYFSCLDFSADVLTKLLLTMPEVRTWKIEGRKKGPHYVYYTVLAYKMLRDEGTNPEAKKTALAFLDQALGRPSSHYNILSHRRNIPIDTKTLTGSGLMIGKTQGGAKSPYIVPRQSLLPGDLLRVGSEDQAGHAIVRIPRSVPKRGKFVIKTPKQTPLANNSPVYLVDRREPVMQKAMKALEAEMPPVPLIEKPPVTKLKPLKGRKSKRQNTRGGDGNLYRYLPKKSPHGEYGTWVDLGSNPKLSKAAMGLCWWWLPPVIWPEQEAEWISHINTMIQRGAKRWVLNSPWQIGLFKRNNTQRFWAGPYCNIANPFHVEALSKLGFSGAIISPELTQDDVLRLPEESPLPLGIMLSGLWPMAVSRIQAEDFTTSEPFQSPKGEIGFTQTHGGLVYVYPNWTIDLSNEKSRLKKAGYQQFWTMHEPIPKHVKFKPRPGHWNWNLRLL